jgi:hypothetical protein
VNIFGDVNIYGLDGGSEQSTNRIVNETWIEESLTVREKRTAGSLQRIGQEETLFAQRSIRFKQPKNTQIVVILFFKY